MNITILGSGTMISPYERNPSGYLLENNKRIALLDCGPGILKRLNKLDVNVLEIDTIFLSHFHQDHCSDVMAVLMRRFLLKAESNQKLTLFGPPGLNEWFATLALVQGDWLKENMPILKEASDIDYNWADFSIKTQKTFHTENSIAFIFKNNTTKFFYSGDTDYQELLIDFARQANLAIIECSNSDEQPVTGHMTPNKLLLFITQADIKKTVVTHIYPENDTEDLLFRIKKETNFDIQIGSDFMVIHL